MKRLFSFALSLGLVAALAAPVAAQVDPTPSTNAGNQNGALHDPLWAHFKVTEVGLGYADIKFVSERGFASCFEYRTDGDTSQVITANGGVNYNPLITDGLYPFVCKVNSTETMTINADEYIEIRMVFGAEGDERFDWTRVDVDVDASEKMDCKNGGWESYGFDNQGQCVRFLTSGKDSR